MKKTSLLLEMIRGFICGFVILSLGISAFATELPLDLELEELLAEKPKAPSQDELMQELIEISYKPAIELQVDAVLQRVRMSVQPGKKFQGQDISTEDFWNKVRADYGAQRTEAYQDFSDDIKKFIAIKYTEQELAELVRLLKSDVYRKMISLGMDPDNPMRFDKIEKKSRQRIYKIVYEKVKEANSSSGLKVAPATTSGGARSVASEKQSEK